MKVTVGAVLSAEGLEVRHNLGYLEGMSVIGQGERSIGPVNLVSHSAIEPFGL